MRVNKGEAFVYGLLSILTLAGGTLVMGADEEGVAKAGMTAVVALSTAFIAGNVTDNGVKGRYFQEGLAKKDGSCAEK